jgi:DNA invertase Pin-like site-specific DNA recombinase
MKIALYAHVSARTGKAGHREPARAAQGIRQGAELDHRPRVHRPGYRKRSDREQFQNMFEDASQRKFDLVLFWSLDRFSREGVMETLNHLQRLSAAGVGYKSFTEQYLDSCGIFKDAVLSILATIAKQERIRISERVHAGLAKARKQGRVGGRPRLVLDCKKVLVRRQEGCTIREIAEQMGVSPASIHRILKGHHHLSGMIPV